jgi:hypothetical protein
LTHCITVCEWPLKKAAVPSNNHLLRIERETEERKTTNNAERAKKTLEERKDDMKKGGSEKRKAKRTKGIKEREPFEVVVTPHDGDVGKAAVADDRRLRARFHKELRSLDRR